MVPRRFRSECELLKVLSHPARLRVVDLLRDGEMCVGDILDAMEIGQSALSQHLALMRHTGVLATHRDGVRVNYYIRSPLALRVVNLMIYEFGERPAQSPSTKGQSRKGE